MKLLLIQGFQKYGLIRILKSMETTTCIVVLLDSSYFALYILLSW
jgi:hypothetical protein